MDRTVVAVLGACALGVGLAACELPDGAEVVKKPLTEPSSADFNDGRRLFVRIKTCPWSAVAAHPSTFCRVDPGYVLIGGGAEVGPSDTPNALLTESRASGDLTGWLAASKDHNIPFAHQIRAYSIGLQVTGIAEATLRSSMTLTTVTSPQAQHPTASAFVPAGQLAVGGGGVAFYSGNGQLLTESTPLFFNGIPRGWRVSAKDHVVADPSGSVSTGVIGLPPCIDNFCFSIRSESATSPTSTGTQSATVSSTAIGSLSYVPAGVGGQAVYANQGRLLTKLVPFTPTQAPGAFVQSKDHQVVDSGFTNAFVISIRSF